MKFHGVPWIPMGFHGMEFHGIPWNSMESHGIRWNSMEFHGIAWNSMEFHGPQLWVLAHTKVVIAATPCFIDSEHDSSGSPARGKFFNLKMIFTFSAQLTSKYHF